jgi:hypothetical protein
VGAVGTDYFKGLGGFVQALSGCGDEEIEAVFGKLFDRFVTDATRGTRYDG